MYISIPFCAHHVYEFIIHCTSLCMPFHAVNKQCKVLGENIRGQTKTKRKDCKARIFNSTGKKKQEKSQNVWWSGKNIKMVITRLTIKTEEEITLVDVWQQDSPILTLELLLLNSLVDMPQIDNKPFLAWRLHRHRDGAHNMWDKRHLNNRVI